MKIFNWVHRKFHQNVDPYTISQGKDDFPKNAKKAETVTNQADTEALLDHVTFVDELDGWKDGILKIGTFGFNPLKGSNELKEYSVKEIEEEEEYSAPEEGEEEDEDDDVEDDKAFKQQLQKVFVSNPDTDVSTPDPLTTLDDSPLIRLLESPQLKYDSDNWDKKKEKKGERITLADLFLADQDVAGNFDSGKLAPESGKKAVCHTKLRLSFTKKLMRRKGEDSRPIRKLHRLITRMLKRKIYPELEGKILINSKMIGNNALGEVTNGVDGAIELVSLLQEPAVFTS